MCSFCGHIASDEHKLNVCASCQTEHYCNRVCQKAQWAAQHKCECAEIHLERQTLGNLCCQIVSCMMVWDRLNQSASTVVQTFSSRVQHAMMDDVLWLVSYRSVGHTVMFSTVSRDALARCIGPGMIDLAMQKSRPD